MPLPPLALLLCALWLALPAAAPAQSDACRQLLVRHDRLRQLYAGGGPHEGSPGQVLLQVSKRMDEFIRQYGRAQRACTM